MAKPYSKKQLHKGLSSTPVSLRVDFADLEMIDAAAEIEHLGRAHFIKRAAYLRAKEIVGDRPKTRKGTKKGRAGHHSKRFLGVP